MPVQELLRIGQAAETLDVSPSYVRVLTATGRLPLAAVTPDGYKLYRRTDVDRLAEERRRQRRQPGNAPTAA
jgi:DNA-binding transcriptional MerR regulator